MHVVDNGCGLSTAKQTRLRKILEGSDQDVSHESGDPEELGMGLIVSKKIVESLGGCLDFYSRGEQQGATFMFSMHMTLTKSGLENISIIEERPATQSSNRTIQEILNESNQEGQSLRLEGVSLMQDAADRVDSDLSLDLEDVKIWC